MAGSDARFVGTIPAKYDAHLGPFLFEPYAKDFVRRIPFAPGSKVLELACGTGILTRRILEALPHDGQLMATDLNQPMLEYARGRLPGNGRLGWRAADATALPFPDSSFDRVTCQFGVMFFPDKPAAFREAWRVLRPGGELAFNVWDSLEANPSARIPHETVSRFFPANPPTFFQIPFGYFDRNEIRAELAGAGFEGVEIEDVTLAGTSPSALHAAAGLVEGCPLIVALQERGVTDPRPIVEAVGRELAAAFGEAPLICTLRAIWARARKA
jgi:SAM-dependent methyltransferase